MANLFTKVEIWVSRKMYHGGDGLEDLGLYIFRSYDEFKTRTVPDAPADDESSSKMSYYKDPVRLSALVKGKKWRKFLNGNPLALADVKIDILDACKLPSSR